MLNHEEIILIDDQYLISLLADITLAENTIDMEYYIFADDTVGQRVVEELCKAARRGVTIRVLVDGVGSLTWGGHLTEAMEKCGIQTRIFHPMPWKVLHWKHCKNLPDFFLSKIFYLLSKINSRNHRKTCIIDKKIIYIGSANISETLIQDKSIGKKWRETSVKMTGINIEKAQYAFDRAWGKVTFKQYWLNRMRKKNYDLAFYLNYSWKMRRNFHKLILDKITHSQKRIWITNSYFVPDSYLLKKLIAASKKGVDVKILLPEKSDVFIISMVASTFYFQLIKNGITIYEYTPTILHAKTLIIDDSYYIGSSNLNHRSLLHDLEIDVEIQSQLAKETLEKKFLNDISQSRHVRLVDCEKQPFYKKILGYIMLKMQHWL